MCFLYHIRIFVQRYVFFVIFADADNSADIINTESVSLFTENKSGKFRRVNKHTISRVVSVCHGYVRGAVAYFIFDGFTRTYSLEISFCTTLSFYPL